MRIEVLDKSKNFLSMMIKRYKNEKLWVFFQQQPKTLKNAHIIYTNFKKKKPRIEPSVL